MSPARRKLLGEFLRFGVVGAVGFTVDAIVLAILVRLGVSPLLSRAVSFPTALVATLLLNRLWTFGEYKENSTVARQAFGYVVVQCFGMAVNFAVFALALPYTGRSVLGSVIALAFGSGIGLFVNFAGSRLLVFKPAR